VAQEVGGRRRAAAEAGHATQVWERERYVRPREALRRAPRLRGGEERGESEVSVGFEEVGVGREGGGEGVGGG